jgi:hypothetical protein
MGPSMEQMRHHSSALLSSSSEITKETAKYTFYWNELFSSLTLSNLTFKDLLPCIDVVLRVALNRLHLDASCLGKLISVTTTPHRPKAQEPIQGGVDVISVLFEILGDGFRMKTKMAPSTIKVLIEVCFNRLMLQVTDF